MLKPFKSSKAQRFKVLGLFSVLTLELLNPLNLEPAFAQANAYLGKTVRVIVGTAAGGGYDSWARLMAQYIEAATTIPRPTADTPKRSASAGNDRAHSSATAATAAATNAASRYIPDRVYAAIRPP